MAVSRIDRQKKRNPEASSVRCEDGLARVLAHNAEKRARLLKHQIGELIIEIMLLKLANFLFKSHPGEKIGNALGNRQFSILVWKSGSREGGEKGHKHRSINFLTDYLVDGGRLYGFVCAGTLLKR
jgi:hypothetical protein